jgi:anti-sigma B factor antagonist
MTLELTSALEGNGVLVVAPRFSHLDASNVRVFRDAMRELLEQRPRVVLDLSAVQFIDSSGLGALIGCLRQLHQQQGDLRLAALTRTVQALFELMRMHRVFTILGSREDAVRSFD